MAGKRPDKRPDPAAAVIGLLRLVVFALLLLAYLHSFATIISVPPLTAAPTPPTTRLFRTPPRQSPLFTAWKSAPETCAQWVAAQRCARAYLDAYIIGVQKGSTSELSTRLYDLGVLHKDMEKEWHFLQNLHDPTLPEYSATALHRPYTQPDIEELRAGHFRSGFRTAETDWIKGVPLVDNAPQERRKVVYDATVELMMSDRVAMLAHLLNPHAKIVMVVRHPVDRALSQYNMLIRIHNAEMRAQGLPERFASAEEFDSIVRYEISLLEACGYDRTTGELNRNTTALLSCMFPNDPMEFAMRDKLHVTRGLYHLHIDAWQRFFPRHRMHFIRFGDVSNGKEWAMQDLAEFLCVRPYPREVLQKYKGKASNVSYGLQAAAKGLDKWRGFDSYAGKDKYLVHIFDSTRKALEEFYSPANSRLFAMMGRQMF